MTQAQGAASSATRRLVGIIADGVVKVLLGVAFIVGAARLGDLLGVSAWLMVVSGVALLIGGGIEIRNVRSRPVSTYTRLMVAYDSGWVLATLVGLLMAWRGSGAGGEVWVGYQAAAPITLAALLVAAAPLRPTPDTRTPNSAA
ncbi:hypothetical protein B7755_013605 [Streptomyces sp. NBS 14/10]|uniref:hypothetical protein n=1 Tax=Streptomyces sp. NBS 14/10 TaxID=1945643 RepID=UPI000B7C6F06|nr:hypothetical protein [Streptomyces sp. NBS 14/10]KAK1179086.1 hypothetical protein B7755_013605 [Streptomyces sp. NBS 14/10]NUS83022.1 hypothetical protein [Streptomyces sp.]